MTCGWCLGKDHALKDCPALPRTKAEIADSTHERSMRFRATKNALLGYARSQGWKYPDAILALDPDYTP